MPVNVSIKNLPDELSDALRERARRNRRSLQKELLVIVEDAVLPRRKRLSAIFDEIRATGLETRGDSARSIRKDRDAARRR